MNEHKMRLVFCNVANLCISVLQASKMSPENKTFLSYYSTYIKTLHNPSRTVGPVLISDLLADILQVTTVGHHYLLSGAQLHSQLHNFSAFAYIPIYRLLIGEERHKCEWLLHRIVTRLNWQPLGSNLLDQCHTYCPTTSLIP